MIYSKSYLWSSTDSSTQSLRICSCSPSFASQPKRSRSNSHSELPTVLPPLPRNHRPGLCRLQQNHHQRPQLSRSHPEQISCCSSRSPSRFHQTQTQRRRERSSWRVHPHWWLGHHPHVAKIKRRDNSVEINLMDALERKDIRADQIDKVEIKDQDTLAGKYISKVRRAASRAIAKRLTWFLSRHSWIHSFSIFLRIIYCNISLID